MKTFFSNNGRSNQRQSATKLLNLRPKKDKLKKMLSLVQAYSKNYYQTIINPIAEDQYVDHLEDVKAGLTAKMKLLDFRNKIILEFWNDKAEEVKAAMQIYRVRRFENGRPSDEDEDSNDQQKDEGWEFNKENPKGKGKAKTPLTAAEVKAQEYNEYAF